MFQLLQDLRAEIKSLHQQFADSKQLSEQAAAAATAVTSAAPSPSPATGSSINSSPYSKIDASTRIHVHMTSADRRQSHAQKNKRQQQQQQQQQQLQWAPPRSTALTKDEEAHKKILQTLTKAVYDNYAPANGVAANISGPKLHQLSNKLAEKESLNLMRRNGDFKGCFIESQPIGTQGHNNFVR